jgi:hypothetical protein
MNSSGCVRQLISLFFTAFFVTAVFAADFQPREFNLFGEMGKSMTGWHGQAAFRSIQFELLGRSPFVERWLQKSETGVSLTYSAIHQPRSWFGHRYGDPDDSVRGEWATLFVRRGWREHAPLQPFVELGTGPMWSNRRVPAATSRFNFNSHLGIGTKLFATRHPIYVTYCFSHISNLAFGDHNPGHARRNPGWNVNSILLGTRLRDLRH